METLEKRDTTPDANVVSKVVESSQPKALEMLHIWPEPRTFSQTIASLFTSEPSLQSQITQTDTWKDEGNFPMYNVWSPAFFGISLPQPDTTPSKLTRNDLIVTRWEEEEEEDTVSLGKEDNAALSFSSEKIIGNVDVDLPPMLCCKCCFQYRGCIRLANGERWRFTEEFQEYFQFSREWKNVSSKFEGSRDLNKTRTTSISWYRHHGWIWREGETKPKLPFSTNKNTHVCRVSLGTARSSASLSPKRDIRKNPTVAVMNEDGFIFLDTLPQGQGLEAGGLRDLIVLTGLAVANYEQRSGNKK
ncbi:hypothetical protein N7481_010483 [Penicillium waksmanii]|uniref:uncharacterized protein n=1 Tax=Penicillium waksmanii TaxID=69791 RepID=UPI00254939DE|nr:uncharacterized protein N7481_010483 [Penicillium waksmanii]KAJ5973273.1 hypothetical protein N7481_010483 [Penicillium waksmanii]